MRIYAIVPARGGSTGLKNKNIRLLNGRPLIDYSIGFAKALGVERIFCSTDSMEYAEVAKSCGAEVPFLRAAEAASGTAMEQDILKDLYQAFKNHNILQPDLIVWLRPTFIFRSLPDVQACIDLLASNPDMTAARTVCESEARLYLVQNGMLFPDFDDQGKSMIRRQDIGSRYKVFSTDVIRAMDENTDDDFLGRRVGAIITDKICGLDIDDETDFQIVEAVAAINSDRIRKLLH
ncbi:N-acylneuraminate cytidylyltransferase [Sphingobium faniae]|nr:N-acylneuraminate cytidylyltransferase [Sphingobium faniae]